MPDGSGERQDPLQNANRNSFNRAAAVLFQVELAFQCVVDRFDELPIQCDGEGIQVGVRRA